MTTPSTPREQFGSTVTALLEERTDTVAVIAEISAHHLEDARRRHPDRVINVGIREQLLVSVGAGLALAGMVPIIHTFAPFLIERAFEQIKLDLAHQGVGAVLVSTGGSFDMSTLGRTHQSTGDVALAATIPGMRIHVPATAPEVDATIRRAVTDGGLHYVRVSDLAQDREIPADGGLHVLHHGRGPTTILALGHVRDAALAAAKELDATLVASTSAHPVDGDALRQVAGEKVVVIEPWLEGTGLGAVASALDDRPRRYLGIGTARHELRQYGTPREHTHAHGLDAESLVQRITAWSRR